MQALTYQQPGTRPPHSISGPGDALTRLLRKAAQRGWRCAVIDGHSSAKSGLVPGASELLTLKRSGRHWQVGVDSVSGGLLSLEMLIRSRRFDLIILDELPCSLTRVRDWLAQTPGSGRVLWLREDTAVLLNEVQTRQSPWLRWLDRIAPRLDRMLQFVDSWG